MKRFVLSIASILLIIFIVIYVLISDNSLSNLQKEETIRIGYAIEAPYAFLNADGEVTGLSPELAKIIVKKLGIKNIEWRLTEFGSLIEELESKRIDVIAAGMFITLERAQRANFSEPTFYVKEGLLVAKGNPKKIISLEQALTIEGINIAVLAGAIEEPLLKRIGYKESQYTLVPDAHSGKIAIETGLVDGLALSLPTLKWMVTQDIGHQIEIVEPFIQPEIYVNEKMGYGAVQFRKEDVQLQKAWNEKLKDVLGSPEHLKMIKDFGFTKSDIPKNIKTSEIINK